MPRQADDRLVTASPKSGCEDQASARRIVRSGRVSLALSGDPMRTGGIG